MRTVGVVGGGQLAQMLHQSAIGLGLRVVVLDPDPSCSAALAGAERFDGSWTALEDLLAFARSGVDVVTFDHELADPDDLALGCAVDGQVVQDARTSDMVFSVPRLVAELSAVVPLLPGDVVFTGTPEGVGVRRSPPQFLQPGQVLESWIEGVGRLRTTFAAR